MFVAIVGCGHGEIDKIYEVIANIEEKRGIKVSLVLCCGDFQSVRNMTDLRCMACPIKYQAMHDFHRYYSGELKVPILTLFIGGNHEASNYLQELPYGGWVAPNMYFMGNAGVLRFGHVRIAGISGIFKGHDYLKGRFEYPPYDDDTMRSVYHYRNLDTFRIKQMKKHTDIVISHDWPQGIHNFGDADRLVRQKPFFRDEIARGELGSRPLFEILTALEPTYWFSAHLHVKFGAIVPHSRASAAACSSSETPSPNVVPKTTKFLALDKVLPRRQFLQVIEIPGESDSNDDNHQLSYDQEWLAILRSTNHLLSTKRNKTFMPGPGFANRCDFGPTEEELNDVDSIFDGNMKVPLNFEQTAPIHIPGESPTRAIHIVNRQTTEFCEKLGITDPITQLVSSPCMVRMEGSDTSELDDPYAAYNLSKLNTTYESSVSQISFNPDEISLDDDEENEDGNPAPKQGGDIRGDAICNLSLTDAGASRRKLVLPPPQSSAESTVSTNEGTNLTDSIFNALSSETEEEIERAGARDVFVIDKVGEPSFKKRRNAAFYQSTD